MPFFEDPYDSREAALARRRAAELRKRKAEQARKRKDVERMEEPVRVAVYRAIFKLGDFKTMLDPRWGEREAGPLSTKLRELTEAIELVLQSRSRSGGPEVEVNFRWEVGRFRRL